MIILGIDASTNCTGYFIFDNDNMKIIDYGTIPNKNITEGQKLFNIYNTISTVI